MVCSTLTKTKPLINKKASNAQNTVNFSLVLFLFISCNFHSTISADRSDFSDLFFNMGMKIDWKIWRLIKISWSIENLKIHSTFWPIISFQQINFLQENCDQFQVNRNYPSHKIDRKNMINCSKYLNWNQALHVSHKFC